MAKKRGNRYGVEIVFLGVVGFMIFTFYMWGKVQIDFVLRENDGLRQEKLALQRERDDLCVQINTLKSYHRIVGLAKKQGMVSVSASRIEKLPVDLTGLDVSDHRVNSLTQRRKDRQGERKTVT